MVIYSNSYSTIMLYLYITRCILSYEQHEARARIDIPKTADSTTLASCHFTLHVIKKSTGKFHYLTLCTYDEEQMCKVIAQ